MKGKRDDAILYVFGNHHAYLKDVEREKFIYLKCHKLQLSAKEEQKLPKLMTNWNYAKLIKPAEIELLELKTNLMKKAESSSSMSLRAIFNAETSNSSVFPRNGELHVKKEM